MRDVHVVPDAEALSRGAVRERLDPASGHLAWLVDRAAASELALEAQR
jgi:hypothetical protein